MLSEKVVYTLAHLTEDQTSIKSVLTTSMSKNQGNTPWVAPACADCPGFLVLDSAPAPASTLVSEPQIVPLG